VLKRLVDRPLWPWGAVVLTVLVSAFLGGWAVAIDRGTVSCALSDAWSPAFIALAAVFALSVVLASARAAMRRSLRAAVLVAATVGCVALTWGLSSETIIGQGIRCSMRGVKLPPCLLGCAR